MDMAWTRNGRKGGSAQADKDFSRRSSGEGCATRRCMDNHRSILEVFGGEVRTVPYLEAGRNENQRRRTGIRRDQPFSRTTTGLQIIILQ